MVPSGCQEKRRPHGLQGTLADHRGRGDFKTEPSRSSCSLSGITKMWLPSADGAGAPPRRATFANNGIKSERQSGRPRPSVGPEQTDAQLHDAARGHFRGSAPPPCSSSPETTRTFRKEFPGQMRRKQRDQRPQTERAALGWRLLSSSAPVRLGTHRQLLPSLL